MKRLTTKTLDSEAGCILYEGEQYPPMARMGSQPALAFIKLNLSPPAVWPWPGPGSDSGASAEPCPPRAAVPCLLAQAGFTSCVVVGSRLSSALPPHVLSQLPFTSFAVVNLQEDLHLQDRAHAGRTRKTRLNRRASQLTPLNAKGTICLSLSQPTRNRVRGES
jgi:hypothetical protein